MALAVALKWLVLGRLTPGRYHAESSYAMRLALVQSLLTAPLARSFCSLFGDTPLVSVVLRSLGARLDGAIIAFRMSPLMLAGADQLHLEGSVTLGYDCAILGAAVVNKVLVVAPTHVLSR